MKIKYLLYILPLIVIALFSLFIPINIYDSFPIGISIIAALFLVGSFFLLVVQGKVKPIFFLLSVPLAIVFGFCLFMKHDNKKTNELKEYGIITEAKPIIGRTLSSDKYGTHHEFSIEYKTADETQHRNTISIPDPDMLHNDVNIPFIYSSRYPNVANGIFTEEDAELYTGKVSQPVIFEDLKEIIRLNIDSISHFLKDKSILWCRVNNITENKSWVYFGKKELLSIKDGFIIIQTENLDLFNSYIQDIEKIGFRKETEETVKLENKSDNIFENTQALIQIYVKDETSITIRQSDLQIERKDDESIQTFYSLFTIIIPEEVLMRY